jgi:hypothetical protein
MFSGLALIQVCQIGQFILTVHERGFGLGSSFAHDLLRNSIATFLIQP